MLPQHHTRPMVAALAVFMTSNALLIYLAYIQNPAPDHIGVRMGILARTPPSVTIKSFPIPPVHQSHSRNDGAINNVSSNILRRSKTAESNYKNLMHLSINVTKNNIMSSILASTSNNSGTNKNEQFHHTPIKVKKLTLHPMPFIPTKAQVLSGTNFTNTTPYVEFFNPWAREVVNPWNLSSADEVTKALKEIVRDCEAATKDRAKREARETGKPLCSCAPKTLLGRLALHLEPPPLEDLEQELRLKGLDEGSWSPVGCVSRQRVAVIVPYKDRATHLHVWLNHYHRLFQRQQLEYRVFVVQQAHPDVFNKGSILNIGFRLAQTYWPFDCVVFHDVDLLAEDDRQLYLCSKWPRHLTSRNNRNNYTYQYASLFGGAVAVSTETFIKANGYTNAIYGWGGEDDVLANRLLRLGLNITRYSPAIASYSMLKHDRRGQGFPLNWLRKVREPYIRSLAFSQMAGGNGGPLYGHISGVGQANDGLNSVKWTLQAAKNQTLYTWLLVTFDTNLTRAFRDAYGYCGRGAYRQLWWPSLQTCTDSCLNDSACRAFSYIYKSMLRCVFYNHSDCTLEEKWNKKLKKVDITYTYFKKDPPPPEQQKQLQQQQQTQQSEELQQQQQQQQQQLKQNIQVSSANHVKLTGIQGNSG